MKDKKARIKEMKVAGARSFAIVIAALFAFSGCASPRVASPDRLRRDLAAAELSYRELAPDDTRAYNTALGSIARHLDRASPAVLRSELSQAGVKIDEPAVQLPLVRYHAVRTSPQPNDSSAIGAPVLLEYDTSRASIYPREGMFLSATAIYQRVHKQPHLSFIAADSSITLGRTRYPLVTAKSAATAMLVRRARRSRRAG